MALWRSAGAALRLASWPAAAAAAVVSGSRGLATLKGEEPHDAKGSLAGRMIVQPPQPNQHLPDPAAVDAPVGLLKRISEAAQDFLRPAATRGRAYHYAEDSAREVLREELAAHPNNPGVESMYAATEEDGSGDMITAPRSWQFSNQGQLLDEKRQRVVAAQNKPEGGGGQE